MVRRYHGYEHSSEIVQKQNSFRSCQQIFVLTSEVQVAMSNERNSSRKEKDPVTRKRRSYHVRMDWHKYSFFWLEELSVCQNIFLQLLESAQNCSVLQQSAYGRLATL